MEYFVDDQQMKAIDQNSIHQIGIPSLVLMEQAAWAVARVLMNRYTPGQGMVTILAGTGNNGADGLAVARILSEKAYQVQAVLLGNFEHATEEWKVQHAILTNLGIRMLSLKESALQDGTFERQLSGTSVIVDAIFGIGLSRPLSGMYGQLVELLNQLPVPKLAVDIPSGVLAGNGQLAGNALRCEDTVTFGRKKLGQVLYPGAEYCGRLHLDPMGFPRIAKEQAGVKAWAMESSDIPRYLKKRPANGHKGTFGRIPIVAGCATMAGAAVFSGKAALRMGAGLVKIYTVQENRNVILAQLPEAILSLYPAGEPDYDQLAQDLLWADTVICGPGLGTGDYVPPMVAYVLTHFHGPVVLDADGINALNKLENKQVLLQEQVILTPHIGEMAGLTGASSGYILSHMQEVIESFTRVYPATLALKHATTMIGQSEHALCVNLSGSDALATAGSGDILTGVIGALAAYGNSVWEAATLGCYIHGAAGTLAGEQLGNRSVLASDLPDAISQLMKIWEKDVLDEKEVL